MLTVLGLTGCVTSEPPMAKASDDPTVVGTYIAEYTVDGVEVVHEFTLFGDGYFEENATEFDEVFFDYGVYLTLGDQRQSSSTSLITHRPPSTPRGPTYCRTSWTAMSSTL